MSKTQAIPRISVGIKASKLAVKDKEVIRLYNAWREVISKPPFEGKIFPQAINDCYWVFHTLVCRCRRFELDPEAYLLWASTDPKMKYPDKLMGWILSSITLERYWSALQGLSRDRRGPSVSFSDPTTGKSVKWVYDASGKLLLGPTFPEEVFDRHQRRLTRMETGR